MLFLICGEFKTGKTVSACTFPKPMLFLDYDNGFLSVITTKNQKSELVVKDIDKIDVIKIYKPTISPLDLSASSMSKGNAPDHTKYSLEMVEQYNKIIEKLFKEDKGKYKTLVIDSLSSMFRIWKEAILRYNNISALRIPDYGTLENILYSNFIPTLQSLVSNKCVEHVVLVDHTETDKDEISGAIMEYPIAPSKNMGRTLGRAFDEVYKQKVEGDKYIWRTRKDMFFPAGSRLNVPDKVEANWSSIERFMLREVNNDVKKDN